MNVLEQAKETAASVLGFKAEEFVYPPQHELGDISIACFALAKEKQINPVVLAKDLEGRCQNHSDLQEIFREIKAVGAYLNFFIKEEYLAAGLLSTIKKEKEKYGSNKEGAGETIMIEYSNGNTHKEYHVGHLRNICFGDAITRLLEASGSKVIPVSYINDFGIHVAKTLWFWDEYLRRIGEAARGLDKGYLLGKCYSAASQKLSEQKEEKSKSEVGEVMKAIESRSGKMYKLWQKTRQWSIDYFAKIYLELGVEFKDTFYESELIDQGLKTVSNLKDKGLLRESQGALIADLESYGLGVLPIIRSDGTALYPVADLALAVIKAKKYKLSESVYVVDLRQSLYFKQLFKLLELMGDSSVRSHLVYDFVTLPDGMMASRTGNVITYHELRQEALSRAKEETKKRHPDWSAKKIEELSLKIALSAIKFEMLKVCANKIITFDVNEALRLNGFTSVYLQYSLVRIKSLLAKAGRRPALAKDFSDLLLVQEKSLLIKLAKYPELIDLAIKERDVSGVAKYLFELAQSFNDYYQSVNILQASDREKTWRLNLLFAIGQVFENGLRLLGLDILEEM